MEHFITRKDYEKAVAIAQEAKDRTKGCNKAMKAYFDAFFDAVSKIPNRKPGKVDKYIVRTMYNYGSRKWPNWIPEVECKIGKTHHYDEKSNIVKDDINKHQYVGYGRYICTVKED